ncbi:MAG: RNA polymerase sigma factor [Patescibacteria group bacterium]
MFDAYYDVLMQYTLKRVEDVVIAGDIVSETFFKALNGITKFRSNGISILHWLYRINSNEISFFFRKKSSISLEEYHETNQEIPSDTDIESEFRQLENELELHENFRKAQQILSELPIKYQEVLSLRFLEDMSIRQVAEILNKPEGTIKSLISRGLEMLRKKIFF